MADIVITGVTLTPNPVTTKGNYKIIVDIEDKVYALCTADGKAIMAVDDKAIVTAK